jgi:hypothetical protein
VCSGAYNPIINKFKQYPEVLRAFNLGGCVVRSISMGCTCLSGQSRDNPRLVIGVTSELRPIDVTTAVLAHLRLADMLRAASTQYLVP